MGGRGKTPVVAMIARLMVAAGERPAIISRGYGRRLREDGVVIVSDGTHVTADLDRSGDEPLMLARAVPGAAVLVCEQRAIAAKLAERVLGATVHILDDGFQHRAMRRDIDIVIVAPADLKDRRAPFGRLRESPSALKRADVVFVDGDSRSVDTSQVTVPVFEVVRTLGEPIALEAADQTPPRGSAVIAVAGIAQPERFSRALEHAGWRVANLIGFPDHHLFSSRDIDRIVDALRESGAQGVLTTEKDAIRLRPLRPLPVPMAFVPLTVSLDPPDAFNHWLLERLAEIRR